MDNIKRKATAHKSAPSPEHSTTHHRVPHKNDSHDGADKVSPHDRIQSSPFFQKSSSPVSVVPPVRHHRAKKKKIPSGKVFFFFVLLALLFAGVFFGAGRFASATVRLTPVVETAPLDKNISASLEGEGSGLAFHVMTFSEEKIKDVPATIEQDVQRKASGTIVIYNAHNGNAQRLIVNTRFETPDGKIFRIGESVEVPGAVMSEGKVVTPGALEVTVYADAPGREYNIGLSDFTIPGFKGDPRYTTFTARSKSDSPMTGGFSGVVKVPSPEAIAIAQRELKDDLKILAIEKARAQVPEGTIFFPGSVLLKYEEIPVDFTNNDRAAVGIRATTSVFFFNSKDLVSMLASEALPHYDPSASFSLLKRENLTFTFLDSVEQVVVEDIDDIRFNIRGEGVFIGLLNVEEMSNTLAGKQKTAFAEIVNTDPLIEKAELSIFPPWRSAFPEDSRKIAIDIINQ